MSRAVTPWRWTWTLWWRYRVSAGDSGPAIATSWVRDRAAVLRRRLSMCFSTVRGERCKRAACYFRIARFGGVGERGKAVHAGAVAAQCLELAELTRYPWPVRR